MHGACTDVTGVMTPCYIPFQNQLDKGSHLEVFRNDRRQFLKKNRPRPKTGVWQYNACGLFTLIFFKNINHYFWCFLQVGLENFATCSIYHRWIMVEVNWHQQIKRVNKNMAWFIELWEIVKTPFDPCVRFMEQLDYLL